MILSWLRRMQLPKSNRYFLLVFLCACLIILLYSAPRSYLPSFLPNFTPYVNKYVQEPYNFSLNSRLTNWRNFTPTEIDQFSVLGRRLFLFENLGAVQERNFSIHVWKFWNITSKRFIYRYGDHAFDPFENCSVKNCIYTHEDEDISKADAVLFHLHQMTNPPINLLPRKPEQIWVWLSDESPNAIFSLEGDHNIAHYNGFFNWSMSYRMDSDVPVPYGRTISLDEEESLDEIDLSTKKKGVILLASHCSGRNGRFKYIGELKRYIHIDIFGKCGDSTPCKGHYKKNCNLLEEYMITIAFENNNCDDYITEKVRIIH